jgi:D-lactate dehydrogenase (cytochrome)
MGVYVDENNENDCRKYKQYQEEMDRMVIQHGGGIGGSVGIGTLKISTMKELFGSSIDALKAIKNALDPNGVLNPSKKPEG